MSLTVALKPSALAVIIGIVELLLGESFRRASDKFSGWHRRNRIHRTGRFRIRATSILQQPHLHITSLLLAILLLATIVLELSIDSVQFKSSKRLSNDEGTQCFGPVRDTKYFAKSGPRIGELDDIRIKPYVEETNCPSLLGLVLQGSTALTDGYPTCLEEFEDMELNLELSIQGGAVGVVANSKSGDPYLDYGMERNGEIVLPDMGNPTEKKAGTSFWHIGLWSFGGGTGFWAFRSKNGSALPKLRIGSNLHIPRKFIQDAPKDFKKESTVTVDCAENNIDCYNMVREKALAATPEVFSYQEDTLGVFISSMANINSSLCIASEMKIDVKWVNVTQSIPNVERNRSGPVISHLRMTGRAKCIRKISQESSRMYLDAVEKFDFNATKFLSSAEKATFDNTRQLLQVAAVITGIKTVKSKGVPCRPFAAISGSTISKTKSIVTGVLSSVMLILTVYLVARSIYIARTCPVRTDPLDPLWPARILAAEQQETSSTSSYDTRSRNLPMWSGENDGEISAMWSRNNDSWFQNLRNAVNSRMARFESADDLWVSTSTQTGRTRFSAHTSRDPFSVPRGPPINPPPSTRKPLV